MYKNLYTELGINKVPREVMIWKESGMSLFTLLI